MEEKVLTLNVKPAGNACNLSCTYCDSIDKACIASIDIPSYQQVLRTIREQYSLFHIVFHGGEPLLVNTNNIIEYTDLAEFSDTPITINEEHPYSIAYEEHYKFLGWKLFDPINKIIGDFVSNENGLPLNERVVPQGEELTVLAIFEKEKYNIKFVY